MEFTFTKEEEERILSCKRDLHMHPEPSHEEYRTSRQIKAFLETLPGVEILSLHKDVTGVVARIHGAKGRGEVGLRADIDALRQTEEYDSPYRSKTDGMMHACGHDFHTACLLGAAVLLSNTRQDWCGIVDLLFQEAEEATNGAQEMIDAGLFEVFHPQMFFGLHNRPEVVAGQVVCHEGPLMSAKSKITIRVKGQGGHGSMPQCCKDPIVAASALVMALQTITSRSIDPQDSVVFTIGSIHGGEVENLIADSVEMKASMRALGEEAKDRALEALEELVASIPKAYGCTGEVEYAESLPMVYNSKEMTELAIAAAKEAIGDKQVVDSKPSMASEDFALIMERVPSFFFWVGSGTQGEPCYAWHHPMFHTNDDGIFSGAKVMANAAVHALAALENQK